MRINRLACLALALAGTTLIGTASNAHDRRGRFKLPPRNMILVIGDGMDDQQITIARNYLVGAFGKLNLDRLPQRSTAQVLTYEEQLPLKVAYVADSANGGTSLATGGITSTGRISTTVVEDKDLTSILELAKAAGYKTGVVTTASVLDATPATFLTNVAFRGCEGPNDMLPSGPSPGCVADKKVNGGKGSIAEQIASGNADVVLGGGQTKFGVLAEGSTKTVLQIAQENGFTYASDATSLAYASGNRLLGLFSPSTMPVRLTGPTAAKVTLDAGGQPVLPVPANCTANPAFVATLPTLADMTEKAMEVLSKNNRTGFILVIESASVDKEAHSRRPCGHIGEMEQLDEVVAMARELAEDNPNTMVLVTADHGQSPQLLDDAPLPAGVPVSYPLGNIARLSTPEGAIMRISYATSSGGQEGHTGTEVPVLAFGGDAQNDIKGFIRQTEVFSIMKKHLKIK